MYGHAVEHNEALRPQIAWTLISNIFHVSRCIFPRGLGFFHAFSGGFFLQKRSWTMVDYRAAKPMASEGALFIIP